MRWDEWRGTLGGRHIMHIKRLFSCRGFNLDLHKMVGVDDPGCFHTHPAKALRVVLWGGYVEELHQGGTVTLWPLSGGMVVPEHCHRVAWLIQGPSYSLWFRWPKTHEIELRGDGWQHQENLYGDPDALEQR